MLKKTHFLFVVFVVSAIVLAACAGPAPAPVQTVVVKETVVVEGQPKEVEKVVTVEVPVEKVDEAQLERQKTVIFDIDEGSVADPKLWNPFAAGRRLDQGFFQAMIEPLFILNLESETGEVIPWLGESISNSEDAKVWTVKLRPGIKWSDGEALNADDFLFTVNLGMNNTALTGMPNFANVEKVDKVDDLTLQFTLKEPDYRFGRTTFTVTSTSSFLIVPEHIWKDQDPTTFTNYDPAKGWPVFSGPYTLSSASETEFVYVRNDNWWGKDNGFKLPKPEKLVWVAYGSEETRTAAAARNDLDSVMNIKLGSFLALQQLNTTTVSWHKDSPYAWIDPCSRNFHFNLTKEPWNDLEMRMAINYAIDRQKIVDIAYEGISTVSKSWLPEYNLFKPYLKAAEDAGLYEKYPLLTYDPEKTKAILEGKGYVKNEKTGYFEKGGAPLAMTIANFDDSEMNSAVGLLVEMFQGVGINAKQDIQPIPTFIDNLTNAGFDTYYFFVCGPIDLWSKMDTFNVRHIPAEGQASSGFYANTQRWNNDAAKEYSAIVDQMKQLPPDDPKLVELYVQAMEVWMKDMPALPIAQAIKLVPFDTTYWTGWPTAETPYIVPATWWQVNHVILQNLEPAQ
ncbi:MAG: ABC transporter substrate-binding protein [Chloroflexota bacterium]